MIVQVEIETKGEWSRREKVLKKLPYSLLEGKVKGMVIRELAQLFYGEMHEALKVFLKRVPEHKRTPTTKKV